MAMKMESFASKLGLEEHELRLIFGRTKIEYDETKEEKNRKKHRYSLESAAHLLERRLLPIPQSILAYNGPFIEKGEYRYELMTLDDQSKVVFFVVTMRKDESVRIISFRQAHENEEKIYRSATSGSIPNP